MKSKELNDIFIGFHNANLSRSLDRIYKGNSYQDLSTVCVIPIRGQQKCPCGCGYVMQPGIAPRVVQAWWGLMQPMNQKFTRMFIEKMEVGQAYNRAVEEILAHPELKNWKYMLTVEEDNCPPPDGLLKLYESMDKYDVVQGLYWTKGENGQPMIYGDPNVMPKNFIPQPPRPEQLQQANGLGMGFNLWKLDVFKKVPKPWFKTVAEWNPNAGSRMGTQDLYFFDNASKYGYKFACDTRIKVGHWDQANETMW